MVEDFKRKLYDGYQINDFRELINVRYTMFKDKNAFEYRLKPDSEIIKVTYADYINDIKALGTALLNLGLEKKRIALIAPNRYEWCVSYLAVTTSNIVVVPLDKSLPDNEIESLIIRSKVDGVIFDKKGYIVTNNHVVSGSKDVNVSLSNGKTVSGTVIGTDPATDLAVVKIDGSDDLPVASFGDSDNLQVGETAIAIGNPLGLEFQGTVTVGVISALNRSLDDVDQRFKLIQTDAAINPGNSGGALVTADGKVVGINSAKISKEGIEGMGFAIPINQVKGIVQQLIEHGKVIRAYLGVYAADKDIAMRYGYTWNNENGVLVMKVAENSPLSLTNVKPGDYILAIDGKKISSVKEMRDILDGHQPGDRISLTYSHNGRETNTDVLLSSAPGNNS